MEEIASIFIRVLSHTEPVMISKGSNEGQFSKARYIVDEEALDETRSRVRDLLDQFPVYPELDLKYLQKSFS